ncbi:Diacylglycerol_kinase (CTP) [Hexamita inflata]|uniref:Diacylglycerol kinase (CTP) n=1 Tax=Hexamita inflata TaxID=28002 RepID=A0AA86QYJ0_9EUKA|nr:Diacylglycerol kinase (CTP) [Hexamita inflata]
MQFVEYFKGLPRDQKILVGIFIYALSAFIISMIIPEKFSNAIYVLLKPLGEKRAKKLSFEIPRKSFHLCGSIAAILMKKIGRWQFKQLSFVGLAIALFVGILEYIRFHNKKVNQWVRENFRSVMRESELDHITGIVPFMLGMSLTALFFKKETVEFGLYCLFLGDTAAAFVGIAFGKRIFKTNTAKSVEGFLGCAAVCSWLTGVVGQFNVVKGCLCSGLEVLCGTVIKLDDNMVIPLGSALILAGYQEAVDEAKWVWSHFK